MISTDGHAFVVDKAVLDELSFFKKIFSSPFKEAKSNTVELNFESSTLEPLWIN